MSTVKRDARLTAEELRERVARIPRIPFAFTPTPLEECKRLSAALGGPRILMKREDLTGLAFGGNKVRAMEFRLADARAHGCDAFVVANIGQSNHARLHSAACARLGLKMVIVKPGGAERVQGNLLLDYILGAEVIPTEATDPVERERVLDGVLADLRNRGYTPYDSTREAFSPLAGTIAYSEMTIELLDQLAAVRARADRIFIVAGTSAAGLVLGGKLLGAGYRVNCVVVSHRREQGAATGSRMAWLANEAAGLLDLPPVITESDFEVYEEYIGAGHETATPETLEAIRLVARSEGIFLDPVYTGRAMAGLIGEIRNGNVGRDETVVFVHTGGLPIIFAYDEILASL